MTHPSFRTFGWLSEYDNTILVNNELLLLDNLELSSEDIKSVTVDSLKEPFKIWFSICIFCVQGTAEISLNLRKYTLSANEVLIVLPNNIGACMDISKDFKCFIIAYTNEMFVNINFTVTGLYHRYLSQNSVLNLSDEEMLESKFIYQAMRTKASQSNYHYAKDALSGYMQVLFCNGYQWLHEYQNNEGIKNRSNKPYIFEKFLNLVEQHFVKHRSIKFYAERMCLTPKYLSQMVYKESGRHAGTWIKEYTILEAKTLLETHKYNVQQVSDMLNFPNQSFFGKYFKASVGCSPGEFMIK